MKNALFLLLPFIALLASCTNKPKEASDESGESDSLVLSESSQAVVSMVSDAVVLFNKDGEKAFDAFKSPGSEWRKGEEYIFVLDNDGNMLVHTDTALEGKNVIGLTDVGGKRIIKGLIQTANNSVKGQGGWYHYQWPSPGGLFPRWKSSFVMPVTTASGKQYVIGSGIYTDRMEREYVVDLVNAAVLEINTRGDSAFALMRDHTGPFLAKDAYVVVFSMDGVDLVNPAFPELEGRVVTDLKDINGKLLVREMFQVLKEKGFGWVDYMWPKPGQSTPTTKSTYVAKASHGGKEYLVGCGVYLADAPVATKNPNALTAATMVSLVDEAAKVFEEKGEAAYSDFRIKGSKWFRDNTYFFVWSSDGIRKFHAANPELEGQDVKQFTDAIGRTVGQMMLDAGNGPNGSGWVHYFHTEPGSYFPIWKSTYVKKVKFPSGKSFIVGCGVYNMDMDQPMIEDLVERAAVLVEKKGKAALPILRDHKGPFVFMDTYIFMVGTDGTELFNAVLPTLEGKNNIDLKDLKGKALIRDEIALALKDGKGWLDGYWYKPGDNKPALKRTYVRKVQFEGKTCIIGSGYYPQGQ
jgi:signal transduction histidine kinase